MDQQMDKATAFNLFLAENGVQPLPTMTLNHIHIPNPTSNASKFQIFLQTYMGKVHSLLPSSFVEFNFDFNISNIGC
jgi:hypothetical protein